MKRFTVKNITTWGLTEDIDYSGYKLPVSFRDDQTTIDKIQKIAKIQDTKSPFYGDYKTMYFKLYEISERQEEDLLNKGKKRIDLSFAVEDTPFTTETGKKYLRLRVLGLKKSDTDDEPDSQAPSDEV